MTKSTASYLNTSRGIHLGRGCEDVYDCRPRDRIWRICECGVWLNLLDNHFVLTRKA